MALHGVTIFIPQTIAADCRHIEWFYPSISSFTKYAPAFVYKNIDWFYLSISPKQIQQKREWYRWIDWFYLSMPSV